MKIELDPQAEIEIAIAVLRCCERIGERHAESLLDEIMDELARRDAETQDDPLR